MPRYYFHYRTDDELIQDHEGEVFDDLDAAESKAAELGKAILDQAVSRGDDPTTPRSIEITDAHGEDLLYVVFWASTDSDDGRAPPIDPVTIH